MPDDDITKCDLEAVKEAHFRLHREIMQEQQEMYERVHRMRAEARQRERDEHDNFERRVAPMRRQFEALTKALTDYENLKPLGPITIPSLTTSPRESVRMADPKYRVVEETPNGWCNVVGDPMPIYSGPWRYRWEAQEYADDLNEGRASPTTDGAPTGKQAP